MNFLFLLYDTSWEAKIVLKASETTKPIMRERRAKVTFPVQSLTSKACMQNLYFLQLNAVKDLKH